MKIRKMYKYIGRNGSITSPILLEDIKHIPLVELRPQQGYVLTNGNIIRNNSIVIHMDELNDWREIPADVSE